MCASLSPSRNRWPHTPLLLRWVSLDPARPKSRCPCSASLLTRRSLQQTESRRRDHEQQRESKVHWAVNKKAWKRQRASCGGQRRDFRRMPTVLWWWSVRHAILLMRELTRCFIHVWSQYPAMCALHVWVWGGCYLHVLTPNSTTSYPVFPLCGTCSCGMKACLHLRINIFVWVCVCVWCTVVESSTCDMWAS